MTEINLRCVAEVACHENSVGTLIKHLMQYGHLQKQKTTLRTKNNLLHLLNGCIIRIMYRVRINEKIMHRENSKKKSIQKKKNAREHRIIVYMSRRAHGLAMRGTI